MSSDSTPRAPAIWGWMMTHPWWFLAALAGSLVFPLAQLPKLTVDTNLRSLLPEDILTETNQEIRETFNLKDFMTVAVVREQGVFDVPTFQYVTDLADAAETLPGVFSVRSMRSEDDIRDTSSGLVIEPFVTRVDAAQLDQARRSVAAFPAVQGILSSADETCTGIVVELDEPHHNRPVYKALLAWIESHPPPAGVDVHLAGLPVFEGALGYMIIRDLVVTLPIVSFVVVLLLFLAYRSWVLVALAVAEIAYVNTWAFGLMAYLGQPLYIMHACMPVILVALVLADEIHIFAAFVEKADQYASRTEALVEAMREISRPVVFTSLTTSACFLSFLTTSMEGVRSFGAFAAFGIMVAMVFSLTATPAVLRIFQGRGDVPAGNFLDRPLVQLSRIAFKHRAGVRWMLATVAVICAWGATRVYIQDSWISNFSERSRIRQSANVINGKLHGIRVIQVELDTGVEDGLCDSDVLNRIKSFQSGVSAIEGVGGAISIADVVGKLHRELTGSPGFPNGDGAVSQYFLLLDGRSYDDLWDFDHRRARVPVLCHVGDYIAGTRIQQEIREQAERWLPDLQLRIGGEFPMSVHTVGLLGRDQPRSFGTALVLVFVTASLSFRSLRKGLVVTVPILLAVLINFALMGFGGIPLSTTTSMVTSIVCGVGIDFAIHLQSKFDALTDAGHSQETTEQVLLSAGQAIAWDVIVVVCGFTVLLFSSMPPNHKIGLIVPLGILSSAFSSMLFIPTAWHVTPHADSGEQGRT